MTARPIIFRHSAAKLLTLTALIALSAKILNADDLLADKPAQKDGMSIQLPKGWQLDEHAPARTLLQARAPGRDKDEVGEFQAVLIISSDAGGKIDAAKQQSRVAKEYSNYKPVEEPEAVTINGLEGVKFGGTLTLGVLKLRTRQYMLIRENRIYTLTFMSLASHWGGYAASIDAAVATFSIAEK